MLVALSAILGGIAGLGLAFVAQGLTWRARFAFPALTVILGLLGAGLFTVFAIELFSPFLGLPIIFPVLFVGLVLAAIAFLVIVQSRALPLPWWQLLAAQFLNFLLLFALVLGSVMVRDALVTRFYPDYGEVAFAIIHAAQTWLAAALILGVIALETIRAFRPGGKAEKGKIDYTSPRL